MGSVCGESIVPPIVCPRAHSSSSSRHCRRWRQTGVHTGTMLSPQTGPMPNTTATLRDTTTGHTLEVVRWRSASWVSRTDVVLCSCAHRLLAELNTAGQQDKTFATATAPHHRDTIVIGPCCRPLCVWVIRYAYAVCCACVVCCVVSPAVRVLSAAIRC